MTSKPLKTKTKAEKSPVTDNAQAAKSAGSSSLAKEARVAEEPAMGACELPLFEVQTLITHRLRYAVRATSAREAAEAVAPLDAEGEEFEQNCLGKMVSDVREVSVEHYLDDPGHVGSVELRMAYIVQPPTA